jgi:hypothetical protein
MRKQGNGRLEVVNSFKHGESVKGKQVIEQTPALMVTAFCVWYIGTSILEESIYRTIRRTWYSSPWGPQLSQRVLIKKSNRLMPNQETVFLYWLQDFTLHLTDVNIGDVSKVRTAFIFKAEVRAWNWKRACTSETSETQPIVTRCKDQKSDSI